MSTYDEITKLEKPTLVQSGMENQGTQKATQVLTPTREKTRNKSSENPRNKPSRFPNREEIQEFSFRLRDQIKVKVQAEVPHRWQKELEDVARELNVKKLELYRFMIGEFLGKVRRKKIA